jgi:RNA polymerase sigma-70 factor (ECF subfamily)
MSDDLVVAALEGDRDAIEALLRWVRPLVVRYCRARVGRQQHTFTSADDVAQEVCLAVLTALPTYRDRGKPFLAFVYGIAAHKVADSRRSAARNRSDPTDEVPDAPALTDGPEQRAIQAELGEKMARLLTILPEKQREIVVLRVVVGLSAEETAATVGSTAGAVRVAQHRALGRLREAVTSGAGERTEGPRRESAANHYPAPQIRTMITPTRYQRGNESTLGQ